VELADTSAWVWTRTVGGELRRTFDRAVVEGEIATCDMVRLELLYSARNARDFISLRSDRIAAITGQRVRWLAPRGSLG
jgi:predicted nucleic acid-binding protein